MDFNMDFFCETGFPQAPGRVKILKKIFKRRPSPPLPCKNGISKALLTPSGYAGAQLWEMLKTGQKRGKIMEKRGSSDSFERNPDDFRGYFT